MKNCPICKSEALHVMLHSKDFCVSYENFDIVSCKTCGFAFTQNAPDAASIGKYYEHADYVSHTDTKEGLFFKVYHGVRSYMLGQKLHYILEHKKIKSLLDIGAGTGYFVNHAKENGIVVEGFEPDANARQQAQKNFNITLHPSLEEIFKQNKRFDAISMWHVLEHVHELDAYFQHFNTLLNDKGLLVIAVPNYTSFDAQFYKEFWAAYDLPKHLWHFSPQSIKKLAANHQFQHLQSYAMPFDSFYIALLSEGHKKSGMLGKISALFVGTISYLKAIFSAEKASSVVYVFRKN